MQQLASEVAKVTGLELSAAQLDQFQAFQEALYAHNEVKNLTRVPEEECWIRHFLDSLLFVDLFPNGAKVLDIGTGPGFPSWPLACARPDLQVTALDSNEKMLEFLRLNPLPNLKVWVGRAEDQSQKGGFDVVTGRAVAPLSAQLEISAPFCRKGGLVLPLRTSKDKFEQFSQLGLQLEGEHKRYLPGIDTAERVAPVYRQQQACPGKYPRRWSEIKNKPLQPSNSTKSSQ